MPVKSLLFFVFFFSLLFSDSSIELKGHLGKDVLQKAREKLTESSVEIAIDSRSGDLLEVLDFAKAVYSKKAQGTRISVFIQDSALGPAAILPFLADEIYITNVVSWGDILLGSEGVLPANILVNQVTSLITGPKENVLKNIARGMIDKSYTFDPDSKIENQTLVLNQNQLKKLGVIAGIKAVEARPTEAVAASESSLDASLSEHVKFHTDKKNTIGRIVIDDRTAGINQSTWIYVKNALDYYKKTKPVFVILELNTPGGEVYAAQNISNALKDLDTQYNIPVVAFINNWAISAGAMLAYSSRYIATVKDGSMGAAEPVLQGEGGKLESASEKVNSAIRTDFMNRASFFDRNPYIAEAMVDKDVILVKRHGKIIKLDSDSQIITSGPDPDIVISPKGKLLTLSSSEMINFGVADMLIPPLRSDKSGTDKAVFPASEFPLFQYEFFKKIPNAEIDTYQMDWKTQFFVFLAHPVVASILFLGMMLGFYMEISTPGFGFPGALAAICLFLIVLSSYSQEIASWLEVIMILGGISIILIDLFLLPTFGFLGFMGIVFLLFGLFGLFVPNIGAVQFDYDTQTVNAAGRVMLEKAVWLGSTFIIGLILIAILARFIVPNFKAFQRFVLEGYEQEGYVATNDPEYFPQTGAKGIAFSSLRPSGKIEVNGVIYDAVTTGGFIEQGRKIEVLRIEGSQVVVNIDYEGSNYE